MNMGKYDPVPGWNTTFSYAAMEYSQFWWQDTVYFEWNFRLVAPCTGNYQFAVVGDGMDKHYI
jgi:hypothetical protein